MSQASDTMRREWKINDAKRDAGLTTPDDIQRFDDIQYGPCLLYTSRCVIRDSFILDNKSLAARLHKEGL